MRIDLKCLGRSVVSSTFSPSPTKVILKVFLKKKKKKEGARKKTHGRFMSGGRSH